MLENAELMPADYQQKFAQAIVGFKITLDEIQAKEKLGQHKRIEEQQSVYQALATSAYGDAQSLAQYMKRRNLGWVLKSSLSTTF